MLIIVYLQPMKHLLLFILFFRIAFLLNAQQVIQLYQGDIPNYKSSVDEEKTVTGSDSVLRIEAVQKPSLTIFLPPKEKSNGTAVVICPGGSYRILAFDKEGTWVAKKFNEWGITAFVLKLIKYEEERDEIICIMNASKEE